MVCLLKAFPIRPTFRAPPFAFARKRNGLMASRLTPEDVVFSFDKTKELNPLAGNYYHHVVKAEKTGERDVTFTFDEKNNRELPNILGQLMIVPKHWWEAPGPDGKPRDISKTTLEPVMGSGPYKIAAFSAGATITLRVAGRLLGQGPQCERWSEQFPQHSLHLLSAIGTSSSRRSVPATSITGRRTWLARWATGYDFPAVKEGRVKREDCRNPLRSTGIMQALVPNMRRDIFKDERVREALNYGFDFEELNRTVASTPTSASTATSGTPILPRPAFRKAGAGNSSGLEG